MKNIELVISIMVVLVGVAALCISLIPERYEKKYIYLIGLLTIVFGSFNAILQSQGFAGMKANVERISTLLDWSESEVFVDIITPEEKIVGFYRLTVKVIPIEHSSLENRIFFNRNENFLNEPNAIDENVAERLFWIMKGPDGAIDVWREYKSGIYTYEYSGSYNTASDRVDFKVEPALQTYWPNLYPSLRDLDKKFIVARLMVEGVPQPVFGHLRLKLYTPQGARLLAFGIPSFQREADGKITNLRRAVRYVGSYFQHAAL
ncbi:hypothetical protein [Halotalea alkalilenta]|uniref:hypothetical protein n=1 Tax=Halotalea alkalilenta TaxID=376489 RepID=UPI0012DF2BD7|nr:hypothetical protein [Halotalea alkalilenta]